MVMTNMISVLVSFIPTYYSFKESNVAELSVTIQKDLIQAIRDVSMENIPVIKCPCILGEDIDQGMRL